MTWTPEQEALFEKIAFKAAERVMERSKAEIREAARAEADKVVAAHANNCPVEKRLQMSLMKLLLFLVCSGVIGGGVGSAIVKMIPFKP